MSDPKCIEEYHRPEIDNKKGRSDKYSDFQESAIQMATSFLQTQETFWEGFKRGFGVPIPFVGSVIEKDKEIQRGHITAMYQGAKNDVPGYKEATITVDGQEFKVLLDATNPKAGVQAYTFSKNPEIAEQYADEFQTKMDDLAREVIAERDAYIDQHGMDGYADRLHRFLNIELPNGIRGHEVISPDADQKGCIAYETASHFDPMTEAAGPEELVVLASVHVSVDQSLIGTTTQADYAVTPLNPSLNNLTV